MLKMTKRKPKEDGWYLILESIYCFVHKDVVEDYKSGDPGIPPPYKSPLGYVGRAYLHQGKVYSIAFTTNDCDKGLIPILHEINVKEIALWSNKRLEDGDEFRKYVPMTKESIQFAKELGYKPNVIKEWQNKS